MRIKNSLVGAIILLPLFASCGKDDFLTKLNDDATKLGVSLQKIGENIGRIPRILGNLALGTDADSNENIDDLDDKVDQLYKQFLSNYAFLINNFTEYKTDNQDKIDALNVLNANLTALINQVNAMNNSNVQEILDLNDDVTSINAKLNCVKNAKGVKHIKDCM